MQKNQSSTPAVAVIPETSSGTSATTENSQPASSGAPIVSPAPTGTQGPAVVQPQPTNSPSQAQATTSNTISGSTAVSYALAEVLTHKDASSCWTAINGNVYDLTSWVSKHPGGQEAILGICGKDGSIAFNGQHGETKKQADILATFKIGSLSQ